MRVPSFSIIGFAVLCLTGTCAFAEFYSTGGFTGFDAGSGTLAEIAGHGMALELTNGSAGMSINRSLQLPIGSIKGCSVVVEADVSADQISPKPDPWNGIKFMLHLKTPQGSEWPQRDLPAGTFGWTHVRKVFQVPAEATEATLILGLEKVTGTVRFANLSIQANPPFQPAPASPPDQPLFTGHGTSRLRGAMVSPSMTEADLEEFAGHLNGNLIRWQLVRPNVPKEEVDFTAYDQWLDEMLAKTDLVLEWAKKRHVLVVLDLHSPPGSEASSGGYMAAKGPLFADPAAQVHFIEVWKKMALRYRGNTTIWGFDLVNEPVDNDTEPPCLDWQSLSLVAGKAVREIDPARTLIIEPPVWGNPEGFRFFNPLPLERVVYSFHMYLPHRFTHQQVFRKDESPVVYPGEIEGKQWDRAALEEAMKPARDFAERYRVQIYVGEFSAARWAPGADAYLTDVISIFEERGWDWSYHAFREWDGWSLEHSADKADHQPTATPTARMNAVEKFWKENGK